MRNTSFHKGNEGASNGNSRQSFSQLIIPMELCMCLKLFSKQFRSYMLKLIYIFGHVLIVNSRCYGRCYVKNLIPLSTFLKFHTHLEENSVRSFQNVFDKSSRVLILAFPRNWIFHGQPHILGYHTPR